MKSPLRKRIQNFLALTVFTAGCAASTPRRIAVEPPCAGEKCQGWASVLLSGGRDPEQNAVAHERNLAFAARTLGKLGVRQEKVFFADGEDPGADLQVEEPDRARRRRRMALGLLLDPEVDTRAAAATYRDHSFPGAAPATLPSVLGGLAADARRAHQAGEHPDHLLLYVTDHGLQGQDPTNNRIVLWGDRDLDVRTLGVSLDEQPSSRRVVLVMAQCFSGSFAALVHQGGDPSSPLAPHDRCGFFAAPPDRPAAGCSPRDEEELYDDYTTRFFAALGGLDRLGRPAPAADFDGDGRVSFEEAHLAAVTLAETQDVPVASSEEWLRRARPGWLALDEEVPVEKFLTGAPPAQRAAAEALLRATGQRPSVTRSRLQALLESLPPCGHGLCEAEDALAEAQRRAHAAMRKVAGAPPRGHPTPEELLQKLGDEQVERWAQAARLALDEVERLDVLVEQLRARVEAQQGRLLRLLRLAEWMALEARAAREGGALWSSYERLRRCENSGPWGQGQGNTRPR
ncbi:MAG: hypothetical protein MUF64_12180 [Polyangiaceae bacterium]|jgi:hypothetical protein|nr:hypothetical protein [Polyangiaceae bacterium]